MHWILCSPARWIRKARAFSLIEVLVATLILTVGIVGILGVMPNGYRTITRAGRVSTITHLGNEKMDQLKSTALTNWGHADLTDGSHPATATARMVSGFPSYSITWTVDDNFPTTNMKAITMVVGYRLYNSSGNPISDNRNGFFHTFQTFISEP